MRVMDTDMVSMQGDDGADNALPASITLATDHVTTAAAGPLADALHAAGVAVERHTFLPVRGEEQHPSGVLLLAMDGPPLPLARLVVPASAPAGVASALAAALGGGQGERAAPATLQLKADGVFVSIQEPGSTRHNAGARRAPDPACAPGHAPGGTPAHL